MAAELGACPDCYVAPDGTGWHPCPDHRPDHRPRALDPSTHLDRARAALRTARRPWEMGPDEPPRPSRTADPA